MSLHNIDNVTYYNLNNEINRPVNGQILLNKDKAALKAFFNENVNPNYIRFDTLKEKIDYLIDNDYLERDFIEKYSFDFISRLFKFIYSKDFRFKSFMAAYKFYSQYAMKTNDGAFYLESMEDRVAFNALFFANGDEELAWSLADEMINQRYQPATPSFNF